MTNLGLQVHGSTRVEIRDSVVANHGGLGINVTNCSATAVIGCRVQQTGGGGVWLEGGDRPGLVRQLRHHFGPFSRISQLQPTPHALWAVFYLVPRLVSC